ncbi:McrB family protein [Peribacillus glennii]|nr:AAA family ATPase [Peribacillus glennii]
MTRQGVFNAKQHRFFGSISGAYTAITAAEISKVTYNIKSAIKKTIIENVGMENIPRTGDGSDQTIIFNIWPGTQGLTQERKEIVCKFSKPDKDEMSIYLARVIPKAEQLPGDIWFVFFRQDDSNPWFGYMRENMWDMFFEEGETTDILQAIQDTDQEERQHSELEEMEYNLIIYGAPGTGKSHYLNNASKGNKTRVTFHPEYSYYDFVGSYKPLPLYKPLPEGTNLITYDGTQAGDNEPIIDYRFVPGPFTTALINALNDKSETIHYLIIEEINRANAAAVFGDLFQLLDRDVTGRSEYGITPDTELHRYLKKEVEDFEGEMLFLPKNLRIVATMNSADQGVFSMDSAFKRRWGFEYMPISFENCQHKDEQVYYAKRQISWENFVLTINKRLGRMKINEDRHIGPFFMKQGEPSNIESIASKLLIYLWDDVVRHQRSALFLQDIITFADLVTRYKNGEEIFTGEDGDIFNGKYTDNTSHTDVEERNPEDPIGTQEVVPLGNDQHE